MSREERMTYINVEKEDRMSLSECEGRMYNEMDRDELMMYIGMSRKDQIAYSWRWSCDNDDVYFLKDRDDGTKCNGIEREDTDWQRSLRSLVFLFCICRSSAGTEAADGSFHSLFLQPSRPDVKLPAMKETCQMVLNWLNLFDSRILDKARSVAVDCKQLLKSGLPHGKH
jgi:hypothetical protein